MSLWDFRRSSSWRRRIRIVWKWLLILMSGISALICVVVTVFWVRSFVAEDLWVYGTGFHSGGMTDFACASDRGQICFFREKLVPESTSPIIDTSPPVRYELLWRTDPVMPSITERPDGWYHTTDMPVGSFAYNLRSVTVPHWLFVFIFAVLPIFVVTRLIRRRRQQREGLCRVCGYDLRATPDRCPECGAEPLVPSPGAPGRIEGDAN